LDVSEAFLCAYPSIREALRDQRLLETFSFFDVQARAHKKSFQSLGLWSLILGLVPLVAAAVRMAVGEALFAKVAPANITWEFCGVVSVCFVLWTRMKRHRVLWCQAVFCRERLRQWHFQKFLDGRLMGLLASHKKQYEEEIDRRWGELTQKLKDGPGMMGEFVSFASHGGDFFHVTADYENQQFAKTVLEALRTLRFEHQLRFSRIKITPEGERVGLSLRERTTLSETVASVTLAGAIVISALAFFASAIDFSRFASFLPWGYITITRCLAGTALLLAVLSAASRAYRAGYTLPDESESYEEYCDRVRALEAVFRSVSSDKEKFRQLEYLEEEAAVELRRFLRMKMRATFVS